ncbi:hypothetical protein F2Q69_00021673 [Brassica cretica]|uniref:Uncharacterized protein n=1 Tax=Brassica cretica TaxID=69181 RepID=A0A8S9QA68_BRACR|nr:hypothetical protein F2Q69_00021673 [Brassica cretica]
MIATLLRGFKIRSTVFSKLCECRFPHPRSLYAVRKIILLELPLSTSILFTKQFATVSEITRASWWGVRILSCSLAVKLISSVPRSKRFGLVVSRPCLALRVLFLAAA